MVRPLIHKTTSIDVNSESFSRRHLNMDEQGGWRAEGWGLRPNPHIDHPGPVRPLWTGRGEYTDGSSTYLVILKIRSRRSARSTLIPNDIPGRKNPHTTSKILPTITWRHSAGSSLWMCAYMYVYTATCVCISQSLQKNEAVCDCDCCGQKSLIMQHVFLKNTMKYAAYLCNSAFR